MKNTIGYVRIKFKNKTPVYILVREIEYYSDNISVINKEMTSLGYFRKGEENRNKNNFKEAVEDYSKAISIDPNFLSAYYNRGNSKKDLKDY